MGLEMFYIVADTEAAGREYCREWQDAVNRLDVSRRIEGKVILAGEADCALQLECDVCGKGRCIGCRETVSIDITGGRESSVCLGCWEGPGHPNKLEVAA